MIPIGCPAELTTGNPLNLEVDSWKNTCSTWAKKLKNIGGLDIIFVTMRSRFYLGSDLLRMGMFFCLKAPL